MVMSFIKKWYGNFSQEELKKYLILGFAFALTIGIYWTMRALKDSFFGTFVIGYGGAKEKELYLALAKIVSLILLFPAVIGYTKLVDKFRKHNLFYVIGGIYIISMIAWALFFLSPTYGLANTVASPWRISGWLWYVFVESFGSIFIALFWAFVIDICDQNSAKRGFAFMVMIGQLGAIALPQVINKWLPKYLGTSSWVSVATCAPLVLGVIFIVYYFVKSTPKELLKGYVAKDAMEKHEEPGFYEGLKLLLTHKYLLGIFGALAFFELISTFIDFNFKTMVFATLHSEAERSFYLTDYASIVNALTFLFLLFGINNIQRWLGIRTALALVPITLGCFMLLFFFSSTLSALFYLALGAKAVNYALNGPSLKQLYIPTTEDVRYKSQAWIETFGSRSAKAGASVLNLTKGAFAANSYIMMLTILSLGIAASWFFVALFLADTYDKAIKKGEMVC